MVRFSGALAANLGQKRDLGKIVAPCQNEMCAASMSRARLLARQVRQKGSGQGGGFHEVVRDRSRARTAVRPRVRVRPVRRPRRRHRHGVGRRREPVARREQGRTQAGLDERARQPQPVRRVRGILVRGLGAQLRHADRLRGRGRVPGGEDRRELGGVGRRPHVDVQDPRGRQVAGRHAPHRE